TLEENLQKLKDKLKEIEHLIGEGFDDVIEDLLREWVADGTLNDIINEEIFNQKPDKEWVEDQLNKTTYYDKYTITKNRDNVSNTDYWLTEIITDKDTPIYFDVTKGGKGQTVRDYAAENKTTISINGSTMETDNVGNISPSGVTIINGEVITDKTSSFQWK